MRNVSSDRKEGTGKSQKVTLSNVSTLRPDDESQRTNDVSVYRFALENCKPRNPLNGSQGITRAGNIWRAKERKQLRERAYLQTCAAISPSLRRTGGRLDILLTRISPRPYDGDGWQAAAKSLRDGIADAFGRNDNDPLVGWDYSQERGAPKEYAVVIQVRIHGRA